MNGFININLNLIGLIVYKLFFREVYWCLGLFLYVNLIWNKFVLFFKYIGKEILSKLFGKF